MSSRKSLAAAVLAAGIFYLPQAGAHHALEYIDTTSYTLAQKGQGIAYLIYDHTTQDPNDPGSNKWEFTPGISYGVTDWFMFDAHMHYAQFGFNELDPDYVASLDPEVQDRMRNEGSAPMLEAAALNFQFALPKFTDLFNVGFATTIEIPFNQAKKVLGAEGLGYEFELILQRELWEHAMITANILSALEEEDGSLEDAGQAWRLAFRMPISPNSEGIAAGIEFEGSFQESAWTVMPGIYAPITSSAIAKMGFQIHGKEFEAARFHASMMYLF